MPDNFHAWYIGKLHKHPMGLEPATSPSTLLLHGEVFIGTEKHIQEYLYKLSEG